MQPESRSVLPDKGFPVQRSFLTLAGEGAMTFPPARRGHLGADG